MHKAYRQQTFVARSGDTEILLVRHGESRVATDERSSPLVNGHGDPELQVVGREQADAVGVARYEEGVLSCWYASYLADRCCPTITGKGNPGQVGSSA